MHLYVKVLMPRHAFCCRVHSVYGQLPPQTTPPASDADLFVDFVWGNALVQPITEDHICTHCESTAGGGAEFCSLNGVDVCGVELSAVYRISGISSLAATPVLDIPGGAH